ncbi:MAG: RIP metalloprotease RseP [Phascolarctobacterium sp.]|nr:RIP metalloprotease RseP [Phascolarctobacterium sp.]
MLTILAAIFVFGVLITVHEFGHFIVAKMTGMKVEEFAIGFGPCIYQTKEGDTEYSLRLIPLGGYNKIAGMDPDDEPCEDGFNNKPILSRMAVILAGAFMNFLLPIALFTGIFMFEGQEQVQDIPVLGQIVEYSPAQRAGLKAGDKVLTINDKEMTTWRDIQKTLRANGEKEVQLKIEREGKVQSFVMTPKYNEESKRAVIGIIPCTTHETVGPVQAFIMAIRYTVYVIEYMLDALKQIVIGKAAADVAGPIGVAQVAGQMAEKGLMPLFSFVALMSINLGVINLLPLPALDGGHFFLLIVEALRGKPLSPIWMNRVQYAGIVLILAITIFSTFKDVTRFF